MSEAIPEYITQRHKYARGQVTEDVKAKLLHMIKCSRGREELLAEDIIEAIAEARNSSDGFRAVSDLLCRLGSDYS